MTVRIAMIVCPEVDPMSGPARQLLGLTVGERMLLALHKAKFTHVVFVGTGPKPHSDRNRLVVLNVDEVPAETDFVWLMPSDLVFDASLLGDNLPIGDGVPIRKIAAAEISTVVADIERAVVSLGAGQAINGRGFAVRVTDLASRKSAEKALMRSLVKQADGLISRYLNRKISTFISKRIASLPITPNQVTAVVFLIGILSGPLAFLGTPLGFALGGFCYWFSAVLDGCDGEISRLKYQGSPLGAWLDTVVDDLVCLSYIVGMYISLARAADHPYWAWTGIGATVFFLLTILPRYYIMAARSGSGDYQKIAKETRPGDAGALTKVLLSLRDFIFRTDFLPFAGMVTAVFGVPHIFAAPFAVGAVASAVDSIVKLVSYKPDGA
jgi:phosphatidylglycerophosphate synthase